MDRFLKRRGGADANGSSAKRTKLALQWGTESPRSIVVRSHTLRMVANYEFTDPGLRRGIATG